MSHGITRDRWSFLAKGLVATLASGQADRRRDRRRSRPMFLPLEDRRPLSTFTVDSTADDGSTGTLR